MSKTHKTRTLNIRNSEFMDRFQKNLDEKGIWSFHEEDGFLHVQLIIKGECHETKLKLSED